MRRVITLIAVFSLIAWRVSAQTATPGGALISTHQIGCTIRLVYRIDAPGTYNVSIWDEGLLRWQKNISIISPGYYDVDFNIDQFDQDNGIGIGLGNEPYCLDRECVSENPAYISYEYLDPINLLPKDCADTGITASQPGTSSQFTRFEYRATAGDVQISTMLTWLLYSVWGFFLFAVLLLMWRRK